MSSECQCHVEGAFCFYCEVYSPVVEENKRLKTENFAYGEDNDYLRETLMTVFQRARNDIARRNGGQCYGTATFADYPFAERLVRDLHPLLFPEVITGAVDCEYLRGHAIESVDGTWVYSDTKEPISKGGEYSERPCGKCGREQTAEGHDACIASLPGVVNACCGHGAQDGYVMFEDGRIIRGRFSVEEEISDATTQESAS